MTYFSASFLASCFWTPQAFVMCYILLRLSLKFPSAGYCVINIKLRAAPAHSSMLLQDDCVHV